MAKLHIKELNIRNNIQFTNMDCINIDKFTLLITKDEDAIMVFKHAINGCEGIPFDKLDTTPCNPQLCQNNYLYNWSKTKSLVKICIEGVEIETTIWNGNHDFVLFLTKDRYISKMRIDYIKGPIIK